MNPPISNKQGLLALSPLAVFLLLYLAVSLIMGDFYKMPIAVAFMLASIYAIAITPRLTLHQRVEKFSQGAADSNIMQMIWIFVLAGAFAKSASDIGCIDATVNFTLSLLPASLVPAGLFIGACFVSLSVGTSVGTIVALVPVAAGIAEHTGADMPMMVAIVVGGSFFGDNLSFISDTTIAATRTQGCAMADKFKANLRIVLPAALLVLAYYIFDGFHNGSDAALVIPQYDLVKIIPYIVVLGCAIAGINVMLVLLLGIISVAIISVATRSEDLLQLCGSMGTGIAGMGDLIIVTLLAGGMLGIIKHNGGLTYLLQLLTRRINSRRAAAFSIAALVSIANVCTANNTIAIITVGELAHGVASRYGIPAKRSASILDTFSCVVQGLLPYGAQILMAVGLCGASPLAIISKLYYTMALGICSIILLSITKDRQQNLPKFPSCGLGATRGEERRAGATDGRTQCDGSR